MKEKNVFSELLRRARENQEKTGVHGPAVIELPPLASRTDSVADIFSEGAAFSGMLQVGDADACVTPIPAPHILTRCSREKVTSAAEKIFGPGSVLPENLQDVESLAPQFLVWWRSHCRPEDQQTDFINLSRLKGRVLDDYAQAISTQVQKTVNLVQDIAGKPILSGTWGYGIPEERAIEGKNRGGPTSSVGHMHVTYYDPKDQPLLLDQEVDATTQLNHFAPWNALVLNTLGTVMANEATAHLEGLTPQVHVEPFMRFETNDAGASGQKYGLRFCFDEAIDLSQALKCLTRIAGRSEGLYARVLEYHRSLFSHPSDTDYAHSSKKETIAALLGMGLKADGVDAILQLAASVRPTRTQLDTWEKAATVEGRLADAELLKRLADRYQRVSTRINRSEAGDTLSNALVRDTLLPSHANTDAQRVWPVHFSYTYIIDDYSQDNEGIKVSGFSLFPNIASTEAVPERMIGAVLRRPLSGPQPTNLQVADTEQTILGQRELISAGVRESFAAEDMLAQATRVINLIIEHNELQQEQIDKLRELQRAVQNNAPIELISRGDDVLEWQALLRWDESQTWLDSFHHGIRISYFHRLLLDKIGYYDNHRDPYSSLKAQGLRTALAQVREKECSTMKLENLLDRMLWGNKFDLVPFEIAQDAVMLRDDSKAVRSFMENELHEQSRVDIFADNAGEELLYDLLFARYALTHQHAGEIRIHVKNYPYNVSDATQDDVEHVIAGLKAADGREDLQTTGHELEQMIADGKIRIVTYPFTTLGIDRAKAMNVVRTQYDGSSLIVSKGDFNYRKHLGWYYWSMDDDLSKIIAYLPFPTLIFRTTKNEILTGASERDAMARLHEQDPNWWKKGVGGM